MRGRLISPKWKFDLLPFRLVHVTDLFPTGNIFNMEYEISHVCPSRRRPTASGEFPQALPWATQWTSLWINCGEETT